jgi:threonine aldolase
VSVCLSKGLGAPVGSLVAGSAEFIRRARRNRKVVGGAMRQAGVIAAAGIVAVTEMVERLGDDHTNAKRLAHGLAQLDGVEIDPQSVDTNLVFFTVTQPGMAARDLVVALRARGILIGAAGPQRLRAALNHHVVEADVDRAIEEIAGVLRQRETATEVRVVSYN